MMQCSRCGTLVPDQSPYCHSCGLSLSEATQPALQPAVAAQPIGHGTIAPPPPSMEAGWSEFGGMQTPSGAWGTYPPAAPAPGGYGYPSNYPYAPGTMPPPMMPAPKRRGPSLVAIMILVAVVVALIFGGVFIDVRFGQNHNGVASVQATATSSATPDATQLYQQVMSQNPGFEDTLQNGPLSSWEIFDKPTYGCKLAADGLHVHIQDTQKMAYCTSGHGNFSNFAIQVDMQILTGAAGGITFRGSTTAGDYYYFLVYPNGKYRISIEQNHKWVSDLAGSMSNAYVSGSNQKNTLTVIAQGSHVYLYINQKVVTVVQDSTYATGYLGLLADDHDSPADVVYTNVKIWHL